jgi:hypothetical protein
MNLLSEVRRFFRSAEKAAAANVVCVLGMHRSGTSCLAGVLQEWGVFLGNVRTESAFNRRGNRENPDIRKLNDAILQGGGGSWHEPPARATWTEEQRRRRDDLIAEFSGHALWGFKDPRLLLTLAGWMERLPRLHLIGTYRHPLLVARSLEKRNEFSLGKGLELWQRYNEQLLKWHDRFQFPVISFDLAETEYREKLGQLRQALVDRGLPLRNPDAISFFTEDLRHSAVDETADVPQAVLDLYRELRERALQE